MIPELNLDALATKAQAAIDHSEKIGEESWYVESEFTINMLMHPIDAEFAELAAPETVLALIAELRLLRNLEEAIRHDRELFAGTSDEDNPMGVLVKRALDAIDTARKDVA